MQIIDLNRHLAIPPVLRLGFRPFFLGGTAFAALSLLLWLAVLSGPTIPWIPAGGWLGWHRHEMLIGFGGAIIAGFLLTAVQNWTGQPGLSGRPLAALAGLWLAGRLAWLAGGPAWLLLVPGLAFLPATAAVIGRSVYKVRQVRNYPVVGILLLLTAADVLMTLGVIRADAALQQRGGMTAAWAIITMLSLIGGRVIPFFTRRGLNIHSKAEDLRWVDWLTLGGGVTLVALTAGGAADHANAALAVTCLSLALVHCFRVFHWYDHRIWQVPLLWSLHLAYAWVVVALFGLGLWQAGAIASLSLPLHALTVGGMGGAILAMVSRVSLGHTGRELTPPAAMTWAFALLNAGALARVGLAAVLPLTGQVVAGTCWIIAFGLFLRCYGPMLLAARADGHPG